MKTRYTVALSMLAGVAVGGLAIQGLHAQAKPPVYVIAEIDISNADAYAKEFLPLVQANLGKALATGKPVTISGEPAKSRVTVRLYDSMEAAKAAYDLPAYKEARKIGDKYATFHIFAVEGSLK
ncbi:DUF1330 domain-containing protein [Bradyrhizobium sp. B124]|uniref:DUF1330 domain-containing protein n=1 Tax=Bradyrhizobium sp. B124 TaxID=3140245 RepID=UPI0031837803